VQSEANNLEMNGSVSVPFVIRKRIEERLKWAENLCVNNWDSLQGSNSNWQELEKRKKALDIFELLEGSTSKSSSSIQNHRLDKATHWWTSKEFNFF